MLVAGLSERWQRLSRVVAALAVVVLSGCAGLPQDEADVPPRQALGAFQLEGRFSLRQDDQNNSGRIDWRHAADGDRVLLSSPFGQGVAEISAVPGKATLTASDGQVFTAPDVPTLTEQVLGYRLPLQRLADWVRGSTAGGEIVERDKEGRPLQVRHEDWRIEYGYENDDPEAPPSRLFAERIGALELRLRIERWTALPAGQ